ncbi:MAG: DUF11 domain-containing protein, partial [Methanobrevibacter sp.]|nr:DUF11 domain-containing protein [Methanobrevibacter sp.]
PAGKYHLYGEHFEDDYYKEIDENNEFEIIPIVDVAIDIGSSRVNVDFNKTVKFTIKVKNNGPNNATGVNVSAIIPEGLVYLSSVPSIGTYNPDDGTWDIGNLDVGENQTLVINVQTNKTGLIDYPVNVSSIEEDSNLTNNIDNKTIRVLMADLAITVNASDEIVNPGDIVNWTITVVNNGPNNASKVLVLLDYSDEELIYLNSSNATFNQTENKWEIPSLLVGDEISIEISTKVNSSDKPLILKANVSSDTYDPIESNNYDSDSVDALPICDLITKVSVSENPVNKDDLVDWTIVVSNDGPDDAADVILSLSDLESLDLIVLNASDDSFDLDDYEWIIGNLDSGGNVSLIITTRVNKSDDTITVTANVETSTLESDYENNIDNESVLINPICDLIIDIEASNETVGYGDIVDWIIVVSNDGPDDASNVSVSLSDLESLGLIILNSSDDSFDLNNYEWLIGDLGSGDSVSLNISTKANRSNENVTVLADVETSTYESDKENNHDNDTLEILPICDISVTKIADKNPVYLDDVVNWIINVTNNGPDKASEVIVNGSFPESLEFIIYELTKGELESITDDDGNVVELIWKVGDLESNESALLVISSKALEEGEVVNSVSANSSTIDMNQSNNFDSAIVDVISNESGEDNPDNPDGPEVPENPDNPDNPENDLDEDYYDEFPWDDYFPDDLFKNNDDKALDRNSDSKSDGNHIKSPKKQIDISKKRTGNPFALVILSMLALFSLATRKN